MRQTLAATVVFAIVIAALGTAIVGAVGCQPADPRASVLKERARWSIELTSWIPKDDGNVSVGVKFSGPPNAKIDELTFRISQLDASQQTLADSWKTIATADVPRGAPKEMIFNVPAAGAVEGMAVDLVPSPTPEDEQHIAELQGR